MSTAIAPAPAGTRPVRTAGAAPDPPRRVRDDAYHKVSFYLDRALWERLARLANEEFRKPDVQANYLLSKLLRELPEDGRGR